MWLPADAGLAAESGNLEQLNSRNMHSSPVMPKEQHLFVANSEPVLRIMRNPRLPEMWQRASEGSGQRPCCLAGTGDIGGANGR